MRSLSLSVPVALPSAASLSPSRSESGFGTSSTNSFKMPSTLHTHSGSHAPLQMRPSEKRSQNGARSECVPSFQYEHSGGGSPNPTTVVTFVLA